MWKKTIKMQARTKAATKLKDKLFILHPIFTQHLLLHRAYCNEMEKLRFIDVSGNLETQSIEEFSEIQENTRDNIKKKIAECSEKCRENIR